MAYESTFDGVAFSCGQDQSLTSEQDISERTLAGGFAVSGTTTVYRDHLGNKPDRFSAEILVPDQATWQELRDRMDYVGYQLITPHLDVQATLDKLTTGSPRFLDEPLKCRAEWTLLGTISSPTPPVALVAGFVFGASGLDVVIDPNMGTTSSVGSIDSYDLTWGDSSPATNVSGGPWATGAAAIPTTPHTFSAPGVYVVTMSVVSGSTRSADFATLVTVA